MTANAPFGPQALSSASLREALDTQGFARVPALIDTDACRRYARLYEDDMRFRKRVVMARHGYGRGEYKYFQYPLPESITALRASLYAALSPLANAWNEQLGLPVRYPEVLSAYTARCHAAGQAQATPLILRYAAGDYNRLHQDVYGEHLFPLQVAVLLSQPGEDFSGGEFVLTEQRPRMQSTPIVVPLARGDAVVFPVRHRPGRGTRGYHRVQVRHGVSQLRSGERFTLGLIFHDAAS